jgi:acyl transferase domain-containing protein/acyl carrier protein
MASSCLPEDSEATVIPTLRGGRGEASSLTAALAQSHACGHSPNWPSLYPGAKRVPLPTYPFQRKRFWLNTSSRGDLSSAGLTSLDHPLLAARLEDPASSRLTLTGSLSLSTHPWLADHAVAGTVLLPGTAFLEAALWAGREAGTEHVKELTLQAPLLLAEKGSVQLQVSVSPPEEGDEGEEETRAITIHSRPVVPDAEGEGEEGGEWTLNASGTLSTEAPPTPEPLPTWPPEGAEPLDTADLYEHLAESGFEYGPAFQGLKAAWSDGEQIYAEVSLAEGQQEAARRFGVHPALLDSALHGALLKGSEDQQLRLPFSWGGVSLSSPGAPSLRVRLGFAEERLSLVAETEGGVGVLSVGSLLSRPVDSADLRLAVRSRGSRSLYGIEWAPLAAEGPGEREPRVATIGEHRFGELAAEAFPDLGALLSKVAPDAPAPDVILVALGTGDEAEDPVAVAYSETKRLLSLLAEFLAAEPLSATRLVFVSEEAVAASEDETPDLALAPALGLLRSAGSEYPGRFLAVDVDRVPASPAALATALGAAEVQVALREGKALVPRAVRATPAPEGSASRRFDPEKTTLITGATGDLGALLGRHLVRTHGLRHLLLVSRRGPDAPGAAELRSELAELGAEVSLVACDVTDRAQLQGLLDSISTEHPLGAVIHTAGVIDDGVITGLSAEQVDRVFAPKVDGAWNLHQLTEGQDLSHFVLFSSAAGVLGATGQGNYAAANSFLDALAQSRQRLGLPASSLVWGLWEQEAGMAGSLDDVAQARLDRVGISPLQVALGLELFDLAAERQEPLLVAAQLDLSSLRQMATAGMLHPLLAGLVRAPARPASGGSLVAKLEAVSADEHEGVVLELVRSNVAAVLGHSSGDAVDPERSFTDLGFDSLAAVEMRNRLGAETGLTLAATAIFDYPSPEKLARHLLALAAPDEASAEKRREEAIRETLARLEAELAGIDGDDTLRKGAEARLRSFLAGLSDSDSPAAEEAAEEDLGSLSNEEIFELIDEEFGGTEAAESGSEGED